MFDFKNNPFFILEVSPQDKRTTIISKAEEKAFFAEGNEIEYDADYENSIRDIDADIIRQMYDFWNSNPVFDNDKTWKDWR